MKIRLVVGFLGAGGLLGGLFLIYRPLCLIFAGALLLLLAARGGKSR